MAEIQYKNAKAHFRDQQLSAFEPVYLLYGDSFIRSKVLDTLLSALLPDREKRRLSLESIDPSEGSGINDAIERLNTYSFFGGAKVVLIKDAVLVPAHFNAEKHLEKIHSAHDQGQIQKAARLFMELVRHRQVDLTDLSAGDFAEKLLLDPVGIREFDGIETIWRYCMDNALADTKGSDVVGTLKTAIERGFPKRHHLVITTGNIDRRTALYKTIKATGTIIDCSVPTGSKKADREEQRRVLLSMAKELLAESGKSMTPAAFDLIFEMTGFDPPVFTANVDKLIDFSGTRSRVEIDDVKKVLDRNREDPIYAFTGAVAQKNTDQALYYLSSLLASGYHYMQLFSALTNQVRRLLLVRDFIESSDSNGWQTNTAYDRFRNRVLPDVVAYDKQVLAAAVDPDNDPSEKKKGAAPQGASKGVADLMIVKNPNNAFPVYQLFVNADRFTLSELKHAVLRLSDADIRLKTTRRAPQAVLEALVIEICRKKPDG